MAKVLMPLLGTVARGQIGKVMVYFPWKGINAVRSYVVPANPNTAGQQGVRGWFKDAVLQWRSLGFTALDRSSYNAWALLDARSLSGFNEYMSGNMKVRSTGKTYSYPYNLRLTSDNVGQLSIKVKAKDDVSDYTVTAYYDTKQGGTLGSINLPWNAPSLEYFDQPSGLVSGAIYWVRVKMVKANFEGWIGDISCKVL